MKRLWIIPVIFGLSACSGDTSTSRTTEESQDSACTQVPARQDSVIPVHKPPIEAVPKPIAPSDDKSFSSTEEAYNEGYLNGQQEGYTDATHHLDYGYNYNDEPEYSGFTRAYIRGYEDGYEDGYNEGLDWNSENE